MRLAGAREVPSRDVELLNNKVTQDGGAIWMEDHSRQNNELIIDGALFDTNSSALAGGAIYTLGVGHARISNCEFSNNSAYSGGALVSATSGDFAIINSNFINNHSDRKGGAIYNTDAVLSIVGGEFTGNTAVNVGGAIYNTANSDVYISAGTIFTGNSSETAGGAIYNEGNLYLNSNQGDIVFLGNSAAGVANDIYNTDSGVIYVNGDQNTVIIGSGFSGVNHIHKTGNGTLILVGDQSDFTGVFNKSSGTTISYSHSFGGIHNISDSAKHLLATHGDVSLGKEFNLLGRAYINSMIGETANYSATDAMRIAGTNHFTVDLSVAADGATGKSDKYYAPTFHNTDGTGVLNVSGINLMGSPTAQVIPFEIFKYENNGSDGTARAIGDAPVTFAETVGEVVTPVYVYDFVANHGGPGGTYALVRGDYNPPVFRGQVATEAMYGSQLAMNNTLFDHVYIDSNEPVARGRKNHYASGTGMFAPFQFDQLNGGLWFKTYANFEKLSMTQGLDIGNNLYGQIVGADFCPLELGDGWKFIPTAYIAYNGGHQYFNGVGMYQNGGQGGFLGTFAKHDFIGSIMGYAGGYGNEMSVAGTTDRTGNWFAGTAAKIAYNFHPHCHWTLQPSILASYNAFGEQKWNSNYGALSMNSGMLNGINVAPGLNLIYGNCDEWNVYLTTMYMYNINDQISGRAGNVALPSVSMRHGYFEYGVGGTKTFKERLIAWGQVTVRNGGRTGVALQVGLQWKF